MEIEYEAVFTNIDKDRVRQKLEAANAKLERAEFLQKRTAFNLPASVNVEKGWARVRDEGDKITLSVKLVEGNTIEGQKEACVVVNNYQQAESLLTNLGCERKAYQETKRELWVLGDVEIMIDTWPFLEPFVEVEGKSEADVKTVAELLGFEWSEARFCAVDTLYSEKYNVSPHQINNQTPKIVFEMENPFVS